MPKTVAFAICAMALFFFPGPSASGATDCSMCHPDKAQGKVVHAAVSMGCAACHTGVDPSNIPHAFTGAKGLSAKAPDLCFGCHGKERFTGKTVHMPVMGGMCTSCHNPHAGDNEKLLLTAGNGLCKGCHGDIKQDTHVTTGHPLEGPKDPRRPGQPFGCVSCHEPHASKSPSLLRYEAESTFEFCTNCHKM